MKINTLTNSIIRGYGQLFLCNNLVSSILFMIAILINSPLIFIWSLFAAISVTGFALLFRPKMAILISGLFSVNGVLFGTIWILMPEIGSFTRFIATITSSFIIAMILSISSKSLKIKNKPVILFTLPYVIVTWLMILSLQIFNSYDSELYKGWLNLRKHEYVQSVDNFESVKLSSNRSESYRQDGLGWNAYFQKNYPAARFHFAKAIEENPQLADAYDGLGWVNYFLNDTKQAQLHFSKAVQINPGLADSWDGFGWIYFIDGDMDQSKAAFKRALIASPLLADAWLGLAKNSKQTGAVALAQKYQNISNWLTAKIALKHQYLKSTQLLAWLLFVIGVIIHSRISALVAAIVLSASVSINYLISGGSLSLNLVYNLAALSIGLGGHYWRPAWITWFFMAAIICLFMILIIPLEQLFHNNGWPLLSLPFNLMLILSLLTGGIIEKSKCCRVLVPFDCAVQNPDFAHKWFIKSQFIQSCWQMIEKSETIEDNKYINDY